MQDRSNKPIIVAHFNDDLDHNRSCSETISLLRREFTSYLHYVNECTYGELLDTSPLSDRIKIVITNTPDMIIAATERKIPVISFSCEFAGVSGTGFYAASPGAAAKEIRRISPDRLALLQGVSIPSVA